MNQDKLHIINKLFNNKTIRTIWDKDEENLEVAKRGGQVASDARK